MCSGNTDRITLACWGTRGTLWTRKTATFREGSVGVEDFEKTDSASGISSTGEVGTDCSSRSCRVFLISKAETRVFPAPVSRKAIMFSRTARWKSSSW